ncbi:MAG: hypothetical protein AB1486_02595 [Planctomycetota bacterium]
MTTVELIAEKARDLPPDKQQELLDFADFLRVRCGAKRPLKSLAGLCEDLGIDISAEDIDQARREMWGSFPREDI